MAEKSKIEWTDASYTPIRARNLKTGKVGWHCEHATTGCEFCYAETLNKRLGTGLPFKPGHRSDIEIFLDEKMLLAPLRWKKPRMIFVCSITDLFADFVPDEWIDQIFAIMALCPQHTFQVLTKRAERMRDYCTDLMTPTRLVAAALKLPRGEVFNATWPLPNCWLGVSTERQKEADERIPLLLKTPAAVRFISAEPLLGPINLDRIHEGYTTPEGARVDFWESCLNGKRYDIWAEDDEDPMKPGHPKLDWVITGGESGPDSRPSHPHWFRDIRDACGAAGVAYFHKQNGCWREPIDGEAYDTSLGRAGKPPAFIISKDGSVHCFRSDVGQDDRVVVIKVGKKAAGRLLDGKTHDAMPSPNGSRT